MRQLKEIDWAGIMLYTSGLAVTLIGLTWGGTPAHPWKGASVLAPVSVGTCTVLGFLFYNFKITSHPLFPPELVLRFREFTVLMIIYFILGMIFYSMSALLPQGTLYMFTTDPVQIGIAEIPNGLGQAVGSCAIPLLAHKIGNVKAQVVIALAIQATSIAFLALAVPDNKAVWMTLQFFSQGSFHVVNALGYFIASLQVHEKDAGTAFGLLGTLRSAGGSFGNAIFGVLVRSVLNMKLRKGITQAALSLDYPTGHLSELISAVISHGTGTLGSFNSVPDITPELETAASAAFKEAYASAYRVVFLATLLPGIIAVVCACLLRKCPIPSTQIVVRMEKRGHEETSLNNHMIIVSEPQNKI